MINPIFASTTKHSTKQDTLAGEEASGQTVLTLNDASDFVTTEPVFISEADGSNVQGLGRVLSKASNDITVEIELGQTYAADSLVWTPDGFVDIYQCYSYPFNSPDYVIPEVFGETESGVVYAEQLGDSVTKFILNFEYIDNALYQEFVQWYYTMSGFHTSFYFIEAEEETFEVRLVMRSGFQEWQQFGGTKWSGSMELSVEPA